MRFLLLSAALARMSIAGYTLLDDYSSDNFFDMFDFYTGQDPTNGFVDYLDQTDAQNAGLISNSGGTIYMGVDSTNVTPNGRPSVRVASKNVYNQGLVILDASHMPGGICGTWPAFWMLGPNWPYGGEIDIIEGVNDQSVNAMTLHTGPGCSISNNGAFTGTIATSNCDVNAPGQATNQGCGIATQNPQTYGSGFNAIQGGVYATEWSSSAISIWFFPRGSIPSDITSGNPDPSGWSEPMAQFQGACDISSSFTNQQIVFDTTFCGDWAGNVWSQSASCSSQASTCQAFVENNPSAFQGAYWTINSLKVYQGTAGGSSSPPPATTTQVPAPTSTQNPQTTTLQVQTSPGWQPGDPLPASAFPNPPAASETAVAPPGSGSASGWQQGDPLPASAFGAGSSGFKGRRDGSQPLRTSWRRRQSLAQILAPN